jgi:hypothetical protein
MSIFSCKSIPTFPLFDQRTVPVAQPMPGTSTSIISPRRQAHFNLSEMPCALTFRTIASWHAVLAERTRTFRSIDWRCSRWFRELGMNVNTTNPLKCLAIALVSHANTVLQIDTVGLGKPQPPRPEQRFEVSRAGWTLKKMRGSVSITTIQQESLGLGGGILHFVPCGP